MLDLHPRHHVQDQACVHNQADLARQPTRGLQPTRAWLDTVLHASVWAMRKLATLQAELLRFWLRRLGDLRMLLCNATPQRLRSTDRPAEPEYSWQTHRGNLNLVMHEDAC